MRAKSVGVAVAALVFFAGAAGQAQRSAGPSLDTKPGPGDANGRFELTVDSIMRGPDLVGYPPSGLRWSADSQKLYFDWRKPGEALWPERRARSEQARADDGQQARHPPMGPLRPPAREQQEDRDDGRA